MSKLTLSDPKPIPPQAAWADGSSAHVLLDLPAIEHTAIRVPSEFISVTPQGSPRAIRLNRQHIVQYGFADRVSERPTVYMITGVTHTVIDSIEVLDTLLIGNPDD